MIISLKRPIAGLHKTNSFIGSLNIAITILTVIVVSQSYRIFMKSSDFLYSVRVSEDYLLIFILLLLIGIKGKIQFRNLLPFSLLFLYAALNFMFDFDTEFLRRYLIMMFWYVVAINVASGIRPLTMLSIICAVGIFSAISMLVDTERTLISYIIEGTRIHAEGEGIDMNINNIALILISFIACAVVLEKNIEHVRFGSVLVFLLFCSAGIIIFIASTRSAILFYLILLLYKYFKPTFKSILLLFVSICFIGISLSPFFDQLILIDRTLNQDYLDSERILSMMSSLKAFSTSPFTGIGEVNLLEQQMMYIGSTDHNFYTKLLGSNGIIGFVAVIIFFCGLIWGNYKNIYGLTVLQSLFCYTFFFSPSGPGALLIATTIFYVDDLRRSRTLSQPKL